MTPFLRKSGPTGQQFSRRKHKWLQKSASLKVAQTNLDYTIIRAPTNGTVVNRNIDIRQTVAQAPTLFTIAQDLRRGSPWPPPALPRRFAGPLALVRTAP